MAPDGYSIPGKKYWFTIFKFIGGNEVVCKMLKSEIYWDTSGDNSVGFSAFPSGFSYYYGSFGTGLGKSCNFWSADSKEDPYAIGFSLNEERAYIDILDISKRFRKGTGRLINKKK